MRGEYSWQDNAKAGISAQRFGTPSSIRMRGRVHLRSRWIQSIGDLQGPLRSRRIWSWMVGKAQRCVAGLAFLLYLADE